MIDAISYYYSIEIPYDGYPEESIDQYNIIMFVIYITMSTAGLIFAIVCLIFNIAFRNKKLDH